MKSEKFIFIKLSFLPALDVWVGSRSFLANSLYSGSPVILGLLKEVSGFGWQMGEVLPNQSAGTVTIDINRGSFSGDKRLSDLLEEYEIINQPISLYSFEKKIETLGSSSDLVLQFKGTISSLSIDTQANLLALSVVGADLPTYDPTFKLTRAQFSQLPESNEGQPLPVCFNGAEARGVLIETRQIESGGNNFDEYNFAFGSCLRLWPANKLFDYADVAKFWSQDYKGDWGFVETGNISGSGPTTTAYFSSTTWGSSTIIEPEDQIGCGIPTFDASLTYQANQNILTHVSIRPYVRFRTAEAFAPGEHVWRVTVYQLYPGGVIGPAVTQGEVKKKLFASQVVLANDGTSFSVLVPLERPVIVTNPAQYFIAVSQSYDEDGIKKITSVDDNVLNPWVRIWDGFYPASAQCPKDWKYAASSSPGAGDIVNVPALQEVILPPGVPTYAKLVSVMPSVAPQDVTVTEIGKHPTQATSTPIQIRTISSGAAQYNQLFAMQKKGGGEVWFGSYASSGNQLVPQFAFLAAGMSVLNVFPDASKCVAGANPGYYKIQVFIYRGPYSTPTLFEYQPIQELRLRDFNNYLGNGSLAFITLAPDIIKIFDSTVDVSTFAPKTNSAAIRARLESGSVRQFLMEVLRSAACKLIPLSTGVLACWPYRTNANPSLMITEDDCVLSGFSIAGQDELINSAKIFFDQREERGGFLAYREFKDVGSIANFGERQLEDGEFGFSLSEGSNITRIITELFTRFSAPLMRVSISVPFWRADFRALKLMDWIYLNHVDVPSIGGSRVSDSENPITTNGIDLGIDINLGASLRKAKTITCQIVGLVPNWQNEEASLDITLEVRRNGNW